MRKLWLRTSIVSLSSLQLNNQFPLKFANSPYNLLHDHLFFDQFFRINQNRNFRVWNLKFNPLMHSLPHKKNNIHNKSTHVRAHVFQLHGTTISTNYPTPGSLLPFKTSCWKQFRARTTRKHAKLSRKPFNTGGGRVKGVDNSMENPRNIWTTLETFVSANEAPWRSANGKIFETSAGGLCPTASSLHAADETGSSGCFFVVQWTTRHPRERGHSTCSLKRNF